MPILRAEARRGCTPAVSRPVRTTRRPARTAGTARTRALLPVLAAPVAIVLTGVLTALAGASGLIVLASTLLVAVGGGLVAHRTVSSFLAGLLLLLARPYAPGDRLLLPIDELGGPAEVEVLRVGLVTTTLCTGTGVLVLPNDRLLRPAR
jgi:small-conductance mechanosensitive channel